MPEVSKIDRITDHIRKLMSNYAAHIERLEKENPAAVKIQEAIREKTVLDADLPRTMALVERALQEQQLSPELRHALNRLEGVCKEAAAFLSSRASVQ